MVRKGELLIDGDEWDHNLETGEIYNPKTGETKSKEDYYQAISEGKVRDADTVKKNEAEMKCREKSSQGYVWDGGSCLSPSQVTAKKEKEAAVQAEKNKKCPEGQRWVDVAMADGGGMCLDTKETAAKKKEEAAKKAAETKKKKAECEAKEGYVLNKNGECVKSSAQKNKDNPELAKQIDELYKQGDVEQDACWDQYDAMRERCDELKNPEYSDCIIQSQKKEAECNNISNRYSAKIAEIKAKMK